MLLFFSKFIKKKVTTKINLPAVTYIHSTDIIKILPKIKHASSTTRLGKESIKKNKPFHK